MVKSKRKNTPKKLEKWKDNRKSIFWASSEEKQSQATLSDLKVCEKLETRQHNKTSFITCTFKVANQKCVKTE